MVVVVNSAISLVKILLVIESYSSFAHIQIHEVTKNHSLNSDYNVF